MADAQATVALNIGSQRISMGVFEPSKNGGLILTKYDSVSILADPAVEMARLTQVQVAITDLAGKLKIGKKKVRYAISGQSAFTRFIKLPPIEDDNIEQLVTFEAQQHVPFPINEVIWDWQLLEGTTGEKEVALVAIKGDVLNSMNDAVMDAGLTTSEVDASPMALYNALRYNYPNLEETTLLIDVGAKTCNLIYVEGKRMFTRSVAVGGSSISSVIAKEYDVSFAEAEAQKCANGLVALNTVHISELDEATAGLATVIRNAMGKLPAEIARTTNYFRSQHGGKAPQRIMLAGGGANLPYVADFFQEKLRLPVEFFNPLQQVAVGKGVDVDLVSSEAHQLGELVGLALRGIGKTSLKIDLVPDAVFRDREASRRKPILIGASVILLVGLFAWANNNSSKNSRMTVESESLQGKVDELNKFAKPLDSLEKKEKMLNGLSNQLIDVQNARVVWADIWSELGRNFASDKVWLVDFEPLLNYSNEGEPAGKSVIKDTFPKTASGTSALVEMKKQTSAKPAQKKKKKKAVAKTTNSKSEINAVRIKGFWRGEGNFKEVYKLIDSLRANSEFFDIQETEKLGIILPTSLAEGAYAAPFEVVLILKQPMPEPTALQTAN